MSDLVERLRISAEGWDDCREPENAEFEREAADRIEALEAEVASHTTIADALSKVNVRLVERVGELEAALRGIIEASDSPSASGGEMWYAEAVYRPIENARAVLTSEPQKAPHPAAS